MPPVALAPIALGIGAAGSGASAAGGKKASDRANQIAQSQLDLQKQQFGLTQQQFKSGEAAFNPALNYWQSLLKGGQAAVQATGPIASQIGQAAQGSRASIAALTPRGGEQNLATAQSFNDQSNNIARLYAGMQPAAASALGQLAGTAFGSGSAVNPQSNPYAAAAVTNAQMANSAEAGRGFGGLIYSGLNKLRQGSGGNSGGGGKSGGSGSSTGGGGK